MNEPKSWHHLFWKKPDENPTPEFLMKVPRRVSFVRPRMISSLTAFRDSWSSCVSGADVCLWVLPPDGRESMKTEGEEDERKRLVRKAAADNFEDARVRCDQRGVPLYTVAADVSIEDAPTIWSAVLSEGFAIRRERWRTADEDIIRSPWPSAELPRPPRAWWIDVSAHLPDNYFLSVSQFLREEKNRAEASTKEILPCTADRFAALRLVPSPQLVRVVVLGQDPYPQKANAHGLSFSIPGDDDFERWPGSLKFIRKELCDDRSVRKPLMMERQEGCWEYFAMQGVLALNSVLTVFEGEPKSHANVAGWERMTQALLRVVSEASPFTVFMFWGKEAQKFAKHVQNAKRHLVLKAGHPSPRNQGVGFLKCRHFSECNKALVANGFPPIRW